MHETTTTRSALAQQTNNFMVEESNEEARGVFTDREKKSASPQKFKQAEAARHISTEHEQNNYMLNAGRPSTEFKTKSGIKAK